MSIWTLLGQIEGPGLLLAAVVIVLLFKHINKLTTEIFGAISTLDKFTYVLETMARKLRDG